MKYRSLIIIVEGHAEEEFVNGSLRAWLGGQGIHDVRAIKIRTSQTSKGGNTDYAKFKNDVLRILKKESNVLVTSLIDYFRLPKRFPKQEEARKIASPEKRVAFLEESLSSDIASERFIPYIQLHEFEALLFADLKGFGALPGITARQLSDIQEIVGKYPNPELINDNPQTAPSKRLLTVFPPFKKVLHGNYIILENGFPALLEKCPRFRAWAENLVLSMS